MGFGEIYFFSEKASATAAVSKRYISNRSHLGNIIATIPNMLFAIEIKPFVCVRPVSNIAILDDFTRRGKGTYILYYDGCTVVFVKRKPRFIMFRQNYSNIDYAAFEKEYLIHVISKNN